MTSLPRTGPAEPPRLAEKAEPPTLGDAGDSPAPTGQAVETPAPPDSESYAGFWQGSPDELRRLEESLSQELNDDSPGGPWVNPLDDLQDDPSTEETFLKIFIDDTLLTLDDLTRLLLKLEGGGTHEEIEKLVAIFHRIKGSAAMVGLKRAAKLAHSAEDVMQHLLETGSILSSELTDAVLKSSDALGEYVENLRSGIGQPDFLEEAVEQLHSAGQPDAAARWPAATLPARQAAESPVAPPAASAAQTHDQRTGEGDRRSRGGETLRVEIGHLDRLMGLAGQLTIQKARFHRIMEQFNDDPSDRFRELFEAVDHLDRIGDEIRRGVMDVRMVPIGPLLNRYHRVVRDLTRNSGKLARLEVFGEKTELDKRMIDELSDPLLQIVRNALDHGIEHPDARMAAGKPREGRLSIHAFHRGNSILIQVSDDGAGLDLDRVKAKSVEKGIVTQAEAEAMSPQQIQALIWKPGMSTARQITEVSGRGVGMEIVRSRIESLHGSVDVDSLLGRGTTFSIRLPLTLAILPCLMIVVDGETFAIPMELVKEIVSLDGDSTLHTQGGSMVRIRQRVLATMRLDELFSWHQSGRCTPCAARPAAVSAASGEGREPLPESGAAPTTLVIVGERGHDVGLMVDRVLGQEDVVIKSISENYRDVPGIAGATILGDGRVALILDIPALMGRSFAQGQFLRNPAR
jgi:chemotaxis protein histidine kinase CheA